MKRSFGFTLAEVLITLGIIGVVAALTLPNLVANYKKQALVSQLRKTVSILEQGFQKMRADAGGVDSLEDTEIFVTLRNSDSPEPMSNYIDGDPIGNSFYRYDMAKYFSIVDCPKYPIGYERKYRDTEDVDTFAEERYILLSDGTMLSFDMIETRQGITGSVIIDVNGIKAPNVFGYDVFQFYIENDGKLSDYSTADDCADGGSYGCYNYLARNGWKMDY